MSLKFNVLIVVQFQRYCQQEAIENLDKSVLTFGSIEITFNWNGFVSLSWHIFVLFWNLSKGHIWQLRDVSSNCDELRWLQGTFMTFLKAATFGICYRVFSEIASIQSGFTAHGGDTSLSTGWVDLTYF